tara:strand:- start:9826 stop:10017 length:192 start_codon:yes stop_codon:yes gene_type:complete
MNGQNKANCTVPAIAVPSNKNKKTTFEKKFPNWTSLNDKEFMLALKSIFTEDEFNSLKNYLLK